MELTKKDVIAMLTMMKCNYPYAYKDQTEKETTVLVNTWFTILGKYPKEVVQTAFYKCLEVCKVPPTIADLMEHINKFQEATEETDVDLWNELVKTLRKANEITYFGMREHYVHGLLVKPYEELTKLFNGLSPILKEYVGNMSGLKEMSRYETLDYEKARFLKSMPTIRKRIKLRNEINPNILKLVSGGNVLQIENKGGEDE